MAKSSLDVGKLILAGAVGLGDIFLEVKDVEAARTDPLKRWKDYFRIAAFAGGLAVQVWYPKMEKWGEAAALAAAPLVVRSINDSVQIIKPAAARAGRSFTPVGRGAPVSVGQRYPAPETANQFKGIRPL